MYCGEVMKWASRAGAFFVPMCGTHVGPGCRQADVLRHEAHGVAGAVDEGNVLRRRLEELARLLAHTADDGLGLWDRRGHGSERVGCSRVWGRRGHELKRAGFLAGAVRAHSSLDALAFLLRL